MQCALKGCLAKVGGKGRVTYKKRLDDGTLLYFCSLLCRGNFEYPQMGVLLRVNGCAWDLSWIADEQLPEVIVNIMRGLDLSYPVEVHALQKRVMTGATVESSSVSMLIHSVSLAEDAHELVGKIVCCAERQ